MDCIALRHTHTRLLSGHPHVPTFEPCPNFPHPALRRASPSGPRMRSAAHPSPADAALSATCEPVMGLLDIAANPPAPQLLPPPARSRHGSNEGSTGPVEPSPT